MHLDVAFRVPVREFVVDFAIEAGREVLALVGPSGSGKTTIVRALAGLVRPESGFIRCGERTWFADRASGGRIDLPPERRHVGYVPQHQSLFPHRTVRGNVAYSGAGRERTERLLERFGIAGLADERPARLSGGERQRVGLARALARDPELLLLDEPLTGLDAHTRLTIRAELGAHLRAAAMPALLVTHSFSDAAALADRVVVLERGTVHQTGTPAELTARPADAFVATLTGASIVEAGGVQVAVQPWDMDVAHGDGPAGAPCGRVVEVLNEGDRLRVRTATWTGFAPSGTAIAVGDTVHGTVRRYHPIGAGTLAR